MFKIFFNSYQIGYVSNRDTKQGSIFIQELCKKLNQEWYQTDISTIASNVNKEIMNNHGRIQSPIFENQLGDRVYFNYLVLNKMKKLATNDPIQSDY